ncbi:DUF4822 domain-containing protein [Sphingobacterium kitahiroshimense]|uniref:DUF4822 domain-containing protein n=1 Tax=Sphingobacterium kitahiroshimense TaxID=470446 RepID=A0ABV0BVQ2_9SPHI
MRIIKKLCYLVVAITVSATIASCSKKDNPFIPEDPLTAEQILSSTPWVTTHVKDSSGTEIPLDDPRLNGFVGFVYFRSDASFALYGADKILKALGKYSIDAEGKKMDMKNLGPDGSEIINHMINFTQLDQDGLVYTITPDPVAAPDVFYLISLKRTVEAEPANGQYVLASKVWKTTGAKDEDGNDVALDDPKVADLVEYSFYKANGDFTIFGFNDVLKISGKWALSADGKNAVLNGAIVDTGIAFKRDVQVMTLNNDEFTYKIFTNNGTFNIINTPVDKTEPK